MGRGVNYLQVMRRSITSQSVKCLSVKTFSHPFPHCFWCIGRTQWTFFYKVLITNPTAQSRTACSIDATWLHWRYALSAEVGKSNSNSVLVLRQLRPSAAGSACVRAPVLRLPCTNQSQVAQGRHRIGAREPALGATWRGMPNHYHHLLHLPP